MSVTFQLIDFRYDKSGLVRLSGATEEGNPIVVNVKNFKYSVYIVPKKESVCESSEAWKRCCDNVIAPYKTLQNIA